MVKPAKVMLAKSKIPIVLGLIGGIITALIGLIALILEIRSAATTGILLGIWGILCGGLMIYGSTLLRVEDKFKLGSILLIVFSALALITLQGLIIGPVIGLIGGILTQTKKYI